MKELREKSLASDSHDVNVKYWLNYYYSANSIVIVSGTNDLLNKDEVHKARKPITECKSVN